MKRQLHPHSSTLSEPYWNAAAEKKLLTQVCQDCGATIFYPRHICPECMSDQLGWKELSGTGTVYSFSCLRQHYDPIIATKLPLIVALIDLDGGTRVSANIINADIDTLEIGAKVKVVWEECETSNGDAGYLPVYELA